MIELEQVSFADLLAPSIADDPTIKAMAAALDDEFREVTEAIDTIILLPELDRITDPALVDLLAWQMHVDFYDPSLPLEARKRLIKESIPWHVRKGTVAMLQEVLNVFFESGAATIQEWFQYKTPLPPNYPDEGWHDRYRFRILIDQDVIDSENQAAAEFLINAYKPVSRWPEATVRARATACDVFVGIGCLPWKYVTIEAPIIALMEIDRIEPDRALTNTIIDLDVYGHNFTRTSAVYYITTARPTTFIDEHHVRARFGTGAMAIPRNVWVREEGRADSNIVILELRAPLVLDSVEPNPVTQGSGRSFDYYGSGFTTESKVRFRNPDHGNIADRTEFINPNHLRTAQFATGAPQPNGTPCWVTEEGMPDSNTILITITPSLEEEEPGQLPKEL